MRACSEAIAAFGLCPLWVNGHCESFNGKLRDELLNGEIFYSREKRRSSSSNGDSTTTPSDRIHRWDIGHLRDMRSARSAHL